MILVFVQRLWSDVSRRKLLGHGECVARYRVPEVIVYVVASGTSEFGVSLIFLRLLTELEGCPNGLDR